MAKRAMFIAVVTIVGLLLGWLAISCGPAGDGGTEYSPSLSWSALRPEYQDADAAIFYQDTRVSDGVLKDGMLEFTFTVPPKHDLDDYRLRFTKDGMVLTEVQVLTSDEIDTVFDLKDDQS